MSYPSRLIAVSLAGLILGLMAVGVVSATPVRHAIQVAPAALALFLILRGVPWACDAALPMLAFWLVIMAAIWLFLLGLPTFIRGHFSGAEISLTLIVGASCLLGLSQAFRSRPAVSPAARTAWVLLFAALQLAAMWASLRPAVATI